MVVNILLSIMIGTLSTGLLIAGMALLLWYIGNFFDYIKGCISKFQYAKSTNWCELFLDIVTVVSLLGIIALISAYMYFQL